MTTTAAVWYEPDGYDTSGKRLVGRQAAGEQFLKGWVRYSGATLLPCASPGKKEYEDFVERIQPWLPAGKSPQWIPARWLEGLSKVGTLYRPDPALGDLAWQRRSYDQRAYSLCGITHTICSKAVMSFFSDLPLAPLQSWDALICTSQAVKDTVDYVLQHWCEYLAERTGGQPKSHVQLPIIPLGVDCAAFVPNAARAKLRDGLRKTLGIADNDIAILYVGRLNFYAKAHPLASYQAISRAARATKKKLCLIQVGWFENDREEKAFRDSTKSFCPGVDCVFLDGRRPEVREQAWAAADVFMSLSDNIQETFGLTPLEAMASGLPVICTDWNGYRATVRHEVDGFCIPTVMPPGGVGEELARDHWSGLLAYNAYIARTAMITAVDVDQCTRRLLQLIENPALRKQLGASGLARATAEFDWRHIIARYEALWRELAERRKTDTEHAPRRANSPANPLGEDPFHLFAHYATEQLSPTTRLQLGGEVDEASLAKINADWMMSFGADSRLPAEQWQVLLGHLQLVQETTIEDLLMTYAGREVQLWRTIGYLLKIDALRIKR
ncbi:D-inositol-3-phosphate glycosyltransferase [Anatilimnocola aggregata]|uniref:D-inositol-3-phosphate glycosyltransferase n=1 Tax=Anatilimnocola aggregata TaxID=2528021 RepID=A0A517YLV3_9BACT|nr:glycosyltransferase family 4 protein [Anatilimnocola aggregata]QDU31191.1 D-inositol-3-phosphate glycosyltransferase [Anatilimnocola aggregata]